MVKNPPAHLGDMRDTCSIPVLGRSPGEGNGNPPQYSGLENSMDSIVHGVAKSWTRLSDFHFNYSTVIKIRKGTLIQYCKLSYWPNSDFTIQFFTVVFLSKDPVWDHFLSKDPIWDPRFSGCIPFVCMCVCVRARALQSVTVPQPFLVL